MKRLLAPLSLVLSIATPAWAEGGGIVEVYKTPNCGCCAKWVQHLQKAGFTVNTHDVGNVTPTREKLGMPESYASCHTAKVGGYVVEGHVPAEDIKRLLKERPVAIGLAAPGMPQGSPGMETATPAPYDTLLIKRNGSSSVYARH
ncbi:MAG: DUF411 domain-containing protein [Rhodocyclaceae bacterium]|nr:DUF411 domain-containing protein [Rhodocyclaceae bacterium]